MFRRFEVWQGLGDGSSENVIRAEEVEVLLNLRHIVSIGPDEEVPGERVTLICMTNGTEYTSAIDYAYLASLLDGMEF